MGVHDPEKVKAAMPSAHVAPRLLSARTFRLDLLKRFGGISWRRCHNYRCFPLLGYSSVLKTDLDSVSC